MQHVLPGLLLVPHVTIPAIKANPIQEALPLVNQQQVANKIQTIPPL
jgi:hypothetical protein